MLLQLLIVCIEVTKLIWENVGIRDEIEVLLAVSFLHSDHVEAESILSSDLVGLWEVVNLLVFIQPFIEIALARGGTPEDVPLMRLSVLEAISFHH